MTVMLFQDRSNQVNVFPNEGVCLNRLCERVTFAMIGCNAEINAGFNVSVLTDLDDKQAMGDGSYLSSPVLLVIDYSQVLALSWFPCAVASKEFRAKELRPFQTSAAQFQKFSSL